MNSSITVTFAFMHFPEAFIQSDLQQRSISNLSQSEQYLQYAMARLIESKIRTQARAEEKFRGEKEEDLLCFGLQVHWVRFMECVFSCFLKIVMVSAVWRLAALSSREEQRG